MGEKLVDDEVTAIFAGNEDANGNVQYDGKSKWKFDKEISIQSIIWKLVFFSNTWRLKSVSLTCFSNKRCNSLLYWLLYFVTYLLPFQTSLKNSWRIKCFGNLRRNVLFFILCNSVPWHFIHGLSFLMCHVKP